jgi:hypothetical protein
MKKIAFVTLVALVGCAGAADPSPEAVGNASQADSDTSSSGGPEAVPVNHASPRHKAPSGSGGGGEGGGSGDDAPTRFHPLVNQPATFYPGTALLLTDGTVMVQDAGGTDWWKLTPDAHGSYTNGTWTQLASPPDGYSPLYFSSAVLPDGRVIVEGGEYQAYNPAWSTQGAIYDPRLDQWTSVAPPAGWQTIGDAQNVVLADGRYMQADCCSTNAAILDPKSLTWTPIGSGKADINDEEGWTLLPSGQVLTVDTNDATDLTNSELFSPRTGKWTSAGSTVAQLDDNNAALTGSWELGPVLLRPNGMVFAAGATGHTATYDPARGQWKAGPDFPNIPDLGQLDVADGPAAILPNGHVLVSASPGIFNAPLYVFEFDGQSLHQVTAPPGGIYDSSFNTNMLVLPTGEILFTDMSNDVEIYTSSSHADRSWAPTIDEGCGLEQLEAGGTYKISGTQLNGLTSGMAYGDDVQAATNYPLVRLTNLATGVVTYARTHDHSTMGVAPGAHGHTFFDVPATAPAGRSRLEVVANGIASDPIQVEIGCAE